MPGPKPSAIDIGFRLLGRVKRLRGFLSIGCVQCTRVTAPARLGAPPVGCGKRTRPANAAQT